MRKRRAPVYECFSLKCLYNPKLPTVNTATAILAIIDFTILFMVIPPFS